MTFYDINGDKLNNGDLVLYRGKRYDLSISESGVHLVNDYEEKFLEVKNNHTFKSIRVVDLWDCDITGVAYES